MATTNEEAQRLSSQTAIFLADFTKKAIPINIIITGPPHIGKKYLVGFLKKYFGGRDPATEYDSETVKAVDRWKVHRNENDFFSPNAQEETLKHFEIGLQQKAALFTHEHVIALNSKVAKMEDEVKEKTASIIATAMSATPNSHPGFPSTATQHSSPSSRNGSRISAPPSYDPRPCKNITLFSGSTITDMYGRGAALWAHSLISKADFQFTKDLVKRFYWHLENLACPSHKTLYVFLEPEESLYLVKVYAYFDNHILPRLTQDTKEDKAKVQAAAKQYAAFCMEILRNYSNLYNSWDMVSRFFTANIRFENDLFGFNITCKMIGDTIMRHINTLVNQAKVWTDTTKSVFKNNSDLIKREDKEDEAFCGLDRSYIIPKIRIGAGATGGSSGSLLSNIPSTEQLLTNTRPMKLDLTKLRSSPRESPTKGGDTPPPPISQLTVGTDDNSSFLNGSSSSSSSDNDSEESVKEEKTK